MFFRYFFTITFIFLCFLSGAFFYLFEREWVDFSIMEYYDPGKPSVILDDDGNELARFQLDKRKPITFDQLPDKLVKAFVAAEDWTFFSHNGISLKGILRSFLVNLYHRRVVQGASTITQQLAKLMFLSYDRTFLRKLQEVFLAFQIERQFTKEQILEIYLNNVYFGWGIYGVETACQRFWNKSVLDITIDEAATLAAVAKSAYLYSPLNNLYRAKIRRNIVLGNMLKLGFITTEQHQQATENNLAIEDHIPGNPVRLYIQEWIRTWAENKWGRDVLYKKGLKIKTSINLQAQELAEQIFCKKIKEIRDELQQHLNGGMLSIETDTGKIKALIGGYSFKESQFNRAFQAVRQVGSTFKPFVYTAALKNGFNFTDIMIDEPFELEMSGGQVYKPKNWTNAFDGAMTLLRALTLSNNIITIKLFLKLGATNVIEWAKRFGFKNEIFPYPSAALGTAEATVENLTASFNVFANYGTYIKPYLIEWVKDEWESKIWQHEKTSWKVLDSQTNSQMVHALSHRIKRAKLLLNPKTWINAEAIGKTGATNKASSTWFVGSTPELTTCVYIGRDDSKPMGKNVFASKTAFPIWLDFNRSLNFKKKHFYLDPGLKEVNINWFTGERTENLRSLSTASVLV